MERKKYDHLIRLQKCLSQNSIPILNKILGEIRDTRYKPKYDKGSLQQV